MISPEKPTPADVEKKMKEMNITGWSSLGNPSPETHMACLEEIQRIREEREAAARCIVVE